MLAAAETRMLSEEERRPMPVQSPRRLLDTEMMDAHDVPLLRGCLLELVDAAPGLVMVWSSRGGLLYMNSMGRRMLGIGANESIFALTVHDFYSPASSARLLGEAIPTALGSGVWRGEMVLMDSVQAEVPVSQVLMTHHVKSPDGRGPNGKEATLLSSIAWDMREVKQVEHQLRHQATHDALTGLPNRARLMECLRQSIQVAEAKQNFVGVLFLDLDDFKQINDTRGHETANQLLRALSQRLKSRIRAQDVIARYGGDEFVLLVPDLGSLSDITRVLEQVQQVTWEPFMVGGESLWISASTGLAVYPLDGQDADTLLLRADSDMYKQKGKQKIAL